jgi:hypothetical protein
LINVKNQINKPSSFFRSKNAQKLTTFILIFLLGAVMAGRKQFILDPYESIVNLALPFSDKVTASENLFEQIHPLYSPKKYVPLGHSIVPTPFLFSAWFHVFSAIAFWALTIGGVFALIRLGSFTKYQSMTMTLFSLFAGSLLTRELLDIPMLSPSPYTGYQFYVFLTPIIPLSSLCLFFMFKRRFLVSGVLVGVVTLFHIKFGFRFFGLLFLSLLLWKFWGSRRLCLSQNDITWRNIANFVIGWGVLFVITYWNIHSSIHFFDSLDLPRSQPIVSQLAWLIKNEPDDWLIYFHFGENRPFFGFLFMAVATGAFCEIIIRLSNVSSSKKFAVMWQIATLVAVGFFGFGFLFESFLIDWLPLGLAHSIILIRLWDLIWVVVIGFWITLILAMTTVLDRTMMRLKKPRLITSNVFFHFAIALFLCINLTIFFIKNDAELVKISGMRSGVIPVLKIMDYVQICDKTTPKYSKVYWEAVNALKAREEKHFAEAILNLNAIYNEFKANLTLPPLKNLDSVRLNILNHFMNHRYATGIAETMDLKEYKGKKAYLWSCFNSEPGIHNRSFDIPTKHYLDAADWVKANISFDKGVIQPPYIRMAFALFANNLGFWDLKYDQHMMYMVKGYYELGLHRLRSVSGPNANEIEPGIKYKGFGPLSRNYFINLTKEEILKIRRDYPAYEYLLTENNNLQGYPAIYSNPSLTLYDISGS